MLGGGKVNRPTTVAVSYTHLDVYKRQAVAIGAVATAVGCHGPFDVHKSTPTVDATEEHAVPTATFDVRESPPAVGP